MQKFLEGRLYFVKVKKSIITSLRTSGYFNTSSLTDHIAQMNDRIQKNVRINERKIAQGIRRAQDIQTK